MRQLQTTFKSLRSLYAVLRTTRRRQLVGLLLLMVAAACAEVVSLGALVPFLALLGDPTGITNVGRITQELLENIGADAHHSKLALTLIFGAAAIGAACVRIALNVVLAKVNFGVGHEVGSDIYRNALYRPYEYHLVRNSSEIAGAIVQVDTVAYVTLAALVGMSSALMAVCISVVILVVDPVVAMIAVAGLGGFYGIISVLFHRRLAANGRVINSAQPERLKAVQEGLGGIRDVLLDQTQEFHVRRFKCIDSALRQAQESNQILGPTPRFLLEAVGMTAVAVLGYLLAAREGGMGAALPTLGVMVVGGQRLLPMLQQAYQGWAMVAGHLDVIDTVARLAAAGSAAEKLALPASLPFRQQITLAGVNFRFDTAEQPILSGVNLCIRKGDRVGIVGTTGSGKSTLLNLIMGLLEPTSGVVQVDERPLVGDARLAWRRSIAHVPQSIFLADASILENVAFGVDPDHIDREFALVSLRAAQLEEFVSSLPLGLATVIGENGVRLSGGQRQRIGIARALYKRASVLVMDEATSALDTATEDDLVRVVYGLGREVTIIMIAHRVTSLKGCDFLLTVGPGGVAKTPIHELAKAA